MTDLSSSSSSSSPKSDMPDSNKRQKIIKENNDNNDAVSGFNGASEANNLKDLIVPTIHEATQEENQSCTSYLPIPILPRDAKVILLDIEGCTTSISFVKDTLFPFALTNLESYLKGITDDNELKGILQSLKDDVHTLDDDSHPSKLEINDNTIHNADDLHILNEIQVYVKALMRHDVKGTGLKSLQGKIWKNGYTETKQLKGHVYQDFLPMLQWCSNHDVSVNIYSSGSISAQKLLFANSIHGDLCHYFNQHFDTTSGNKKDKQSYITIAKALNIDIQNLCFVSDSESELVAAKDAGVGYVVMSVRPGNEPLTKDGRQFPIIHSLLQLCGSGY